MANGQIIISESMRANHCSPSSEVRSGKPLTNLQLTHWIMVVLDHYTRRIIGFECMLVTSMVHRPATCSTMQLLGRVGLNVSVLTMTRCSNITAGRYIVAGYFIYQWQPEVGIRQGQARDIPSQHHFSRKTPNTITLLQRQLAFLPRALLVSTKAGSGTTS